MPSVEIPIWVWILIVPFASYGLINFVYTVWKGLIRNDK